MEFFILMKGLPGSGKSTLAAALARELRCPLIDKDDARDVFQSVLPQAPDLDWNGLSYDVMFRLAERQLALGLSVVVDCPFARVSLYQRALELAAKVEKLRCAPAATASRHMPQETVTHLQTPFECGPFAAEAAPAASNSTGDPAHVELTEGSRGSRAGINPETGEQLAVVVVVVDVECSDEGLWRRRLEARGAEDAGTERSHKPGSWAQLQAIISRYGDTWRWSTDGRTHVPYHMRVDTATAPTAECVAAVVGYLQELRNAGGVDEAR